MRSASPSGLSHQESIFPRPNLYSSNPGDWVAVNLFCLEPLNLVLKTQTSVFLQSTNKTKTLNHSSGITRAV